MAIVSNLDLIRRVPMFRDLSVMQSGIVSASGTATSGELIVEQGKVSNALFMILAGKARVLSQDERGREVIIATLDGRLRGEMSLIDGQPHSATVRSEGQTDMLVLGRDAFVRCLQENMPMADSVMRSLVHRLRQADKQIHSLALMDVYARVLSVLQDMARRWQRRGKFCVKRFRARM